VILFQVRPYRSGEDEPGFEAIGGRGNHKRRTVLRWALLSNGYFVHFLILHL